jgi:acetyl-CoA carboxylase biotin carboxyl carrier protein
MRNEEQRGSNMADTKSAMQVDAALVRQLAELLDETHLTEIEVQDGERKIRVARNVSVAAAPVIHAPVAAAPAPVATAAAPVAEAAAAPAANALKSPMVGTVFLAAEPGAKPFSAVGDTVTEGQTLLIIEAMKVMNPIAAPRTGKVTQVLVENGQPVEFDQPLLVIE